MNHTSYPQSLWQERVARVYPGLLAELEALPLKLDGTRSQQALENCTMLPPPRNRRLLAKSDLGELLDWLARVWGDRRPDVTLVLYAWYDELADQLLFSVVAGSLQDGLPFGGPTNVSSKVEPIAAAFLRPGNDGTWPPMRISGARSTASPLRSVRRPLTVYAVEIGKRSIGDVATFTTSTRFKPSIAGT